MKPSSKKTTVKVNIVQFNLVALVFLCIVLAFFEYAPVVDDARKAFPETFGDVCDCACVLESRPWYGQINQRLWFWLISTPLVVFLTLPATPWWLRASRSVFITTLSYGVIILAVPEAFEVINAPFYHSEIWSDASAVDIFKSRCIDNSDSGPLAFSLGLGWIPALIYTGWWEIAWHQYHKRKTKLIDKNFKTDWINRIVVFASVVIPALLLASIVILLWL